MVKKKLTKKQGGGSYELRFRTFTGKNISLNVDKGDTIKEIKEQLKGELESIHEIDISPKYIKLLYRTKELKDDDSIDNHYKLGKETKAIDIIVNFKGMDHDLLAKAKINLEIAKMFQGSTVRKSEDLEQLQNDLLESIANEIKSEDIPREYSEKIVKSGKRSTKKNKKRKTKRPKKHKGQKGGAVCVPCISPILSGLGVFGAGAAATGAVAAGVKGISMSKSKMSSSNGKIKREQSFDKSLSKIHTNSSKKKKKTKRKDDKLKFHIKQDNNVVTFKRNNEKSQKKVFNKSKNMKENIKKASEFYDKKIHYCVVKGYKKC